MTLIRILPLQIMIVIARLIPASICLAFLFVHSTCFSQILHEDVQRVYNFSPGKLSKEEQAKRIPLMDEFWNKVKSDTAKYLPELRRELGHEANPRFFYFEASQLLLSLSGAPSDMQLALTAISRSDINDIDARTYVSLLIYLSRANLDTSDAALQILERKDFEFYVPQHAFIIDQTYCLLFSLIACQPDFYVRKLINRYNQSETKIKKSIVTVLWYANSCVGNDFLKALVGDPGADKEMVSFVESQMNRKIKKVAVMKEVDKMSMDQLIEAQKNAVERLSDEAIYDLDYMTTRMRKLGCRQP